jgi:putative tryptophan/tyrosine transport system substrate-binding protein
MASHIGRRKFLARLGGAGAAWPLAARAQQPAMPVIGFLRDTSLADATHLVAAFRQGLKEAGFVEGQNVAIEYRSAEDQAHQLPALVADLVRRQVALIVGNTSSSLAAKAVTTTVPIVFVTGEDPVINGLVVSLSRPGGNTTGVSFLSSASVTKRLELLRQLVSKPGAIAMLVHPNLSTDTEKELRDVQAASQASGQELLVVEAGSDREIERAFARFAQRGAVALFIGSHAFFNSRRERVAALAVRYALPATYSLREFAAAGGLMSYGTSIMPPLHRAAASPARRGSGIKAVATWRACRVATEARHGFHRGAPFRGSFARRARRAGTVAPISFSAFLQTILRGAAVSLLDGPAD